MADEHFIGKQTVLVEAPATCNGTAIQKEVNRICQDDLFPSMEKVFNQYVQAGEYLEITSLELDLGVLQGALNKDIFLEKTVAVLDQQLRKLLSKEPDTYQRRSTQEGHFSAWLNFLETGQLGSYIREQGERLIQESVLQNIASNQQALRQYKACLLKHPDNLRRLVMQHSRGFLLQLLQAYHGRSFQDVPKQISEIRSLFQWIKRRDIDGTLIRVEMLEQLSIDTGLWEAYFELFLRLETKPTFERLLKTLLSKIELEAGASIMVIKQSLQWLRSSEETFPNIKKVIDNLETFERRSFSKNAIPSEPSDSQKPYYDRYLKSRHSELIKEETEKSAKTLLYPGSIDEEGLLLNQAGLILVHPYLTTFFSKLNLLEGTQFRDHQARAKACHLLHYVATKQEHVPEYEMVFSKFLCAVPIQEVLDRNLRLKDAEKHEAEELLKAVIKNWGVLDGNSPDALREGFFARAGKITSTDLGWRLQVEYKTIDILLTKLPWNLGLAKLPWLKGLITIEWAK